MNSESRDILFSQLIEEWFEQKKDTVKESTYAQYYTVLHNHIEPELGHYHTVEINEKLLNEFLRKKLRSGRKKDSGGLSAKTVSDIRMVLMQVIEYGIKRRYLTPLQDRVFSPRAREPEINVLTKMDEMKLVMYMEAHMQPFNLGILLSLYGGLRIGELCALRWIDYDVEEGIIHISKTMMRVANVEKGGSKTRVIIDTPKTDKSIRKVPLPSFLQRVLSRNQREGECYIITGTTEYMEPRLCLIRYKKVLDNAGLPSYSFHTLRHTFATRCVEYGFDIKILSEILGHANVSITLQRYVHPTLEMKRKQMELLNIDGFLC